MQYTLSNKLLTDVRLKFEGQLQISLKLCN